jgi:hypothetical protein
MIIFCGLYSFIFNKFQMLLVPFTERIPAVETQMKMEERKRDEKM